jgi:spermidine/putrescine-binding protein
MSSMHSTRALLMAGALLTALLAVSCKSEKKEAEPTQAAEARKPASNDPARFKGQTLNLLVWEGYAEPAFTKGFEEKYGVTVKAAYLSSNDELIAKLTGGGGDVYDIISPSADIVSVLIQGNLVHPIDPARLSSFNDLAEPLRNRKDVWKDGKLYGVAFLWGPNYLVYDANLIPEEPKSWDILFDPRFKGKVSLWDDISALYVMGQLLGYDATDKAALYNMSEEQLAQVQAKLLELKPQVRKYWVSVGELNDLFKNKEVVVALGWPLTPFKLNKEGMNLKATIPKEGATGFLDRLMIPAGSKNKELAELYLDYIIQPQTMAKVAESTGYSVSNPKAAQFMSPEIQALTFVNEMDSYFQRISFWQYVKNRRRYNEVWNEVKAAR